MLRAAHQRSEWLHHIHRATLGFVSLIALPVILATPVTVAASTSPNFTDVVRALMPLPKDQDTTQWDLGVMDGSQNIISWDKKAQQYTDDLSSASSAPAIVKSGSISMALDDFMGHRSNGKPFAPRDFYVELAGPMAGVIQVDIFTGLDRLPMSFYRALKQNGFQVRRLTCYGRDMGMDSAMLIKISSAKTFSAYGLLVKDCGAVACVNMLKIRYPMYDSEHAPTRDEFIFSDYKADLKAEPLAECQDSFN